MPAIIHKPRLRACAERVCGSIVSVSKSARVCTCKGAVLRSEVTPELERQVFRGIEAVQLYETSAYVGQLGPHHRHTCTPCTAYMRARARTHTDTSLATQISCGQMYSGTGSRRKRNVEENEARPFQTTPHSGSGPNPRAFVCVHFPSFSLASSSPNTPR